MLKRNHKKYDVMYNIVATHKIQINIKCFEIKKCTYFCK